MWEVLATIRRGMAESMTGAEAKQNAALRGVMEDTSATREEVAALCQRLFAETSTKPTKWSDLTQMQKWVLVGAIRYEAEVKQGWWERVTTYKNHRKVERVAC